MTVADHLCLFVNTSLKKDTELTTKWFILELWFLCLKRPKIPKLSDIIRRYVSYLSDIINMAALSKTGNTR